DVAKDEAAAPAGEIALAETPRAGSQGARSWAQPPPPAPAPVATPPATAAPARSSRADADEAAPAQTAANQRERAQVKTSPVVVFQEQVRSNRCTNQLFEAYKKVKASDSGYAVSASDRLYVAQCYRKAELYELARVECEALRVQHPELAKRIEDE